MATRSVEHLQAAAIAAPTPEDEAFDLQPTGLVVRRAPQFGEWEHLGDWLRKVEGAHQWWIGDWLNVGELNFGEQYAQAVDATGWDLRTLMQYRWVCEKVSFERRIEGLSFFHHREVADLEPDEQAKWLQRALDGEDGARWSVERLRNELNAAARGRLFGVWVLVEARDSADADALVERFVAEGRKAKVRGGKKDKDVEPAEEDVL